MSHMIMPLSFICHLNGCIKRRVGSPGPPLLFPPRPWVPDPIDRQPPLFVSPCDYNDFMGMLLSFALSLPHWALAAWVRDPTLGGLAWPEGAGVQGLSHRARDLLASYEEQLVGVLAIGCGPLHVQSEGEAIAHLVQGELGLELPSRDGVHANGDVGSVVHPPPDKMFILLLPLLLLMMLVLLMLLLLVLLSLFLMLLLRLLLLLLLVVMFSSSA